MDFRASASAKIEASIPVKQLRRFAEDWLLDCELQQHSSQTLYCRKDYLKKFFWFLQHRGFEAVGTPEIKQFMLYLSNGHEEPGGRWGNPKMTQPMRPVSIHAYYRVLKAMFNWLVEDDAIEQSPMRRVKAPLVRTDIKQPLPDDSVLALLKAVKQSKSPRRNEAMLLTLLDTGIRASELCSLKMKDLDLTARSFRVLGKGNKYRTCFIGRVTTKAISAYLRSQDREPEGTVFIAEGGTKAGQGITASGLYQIIRELADIAGIESKNCSPHALRRTFAVSMLRRGANVFTVQTMMGHTDLDMTRRYCAVATADVENQHREFSPADGLKIRSI